MPTCGGKVRLGAVWRIGQRRERASGRGRGRRVRRVRRYGLQHSQSLGGSSCSETLAVVFLFSWLKIQRLMEAKWIHRPGPGMSPQGHTVTRQAELARVHKETQFLPCSCPCTRALPFRKNVKRFCTQFPALACGGRSLHTTTKQFSSTSGVSHN